MSKQQQSFGVVIVGDEILSTKRLDGHFDFIATILQQRCAQLNWARFVPDDIEVQAQAYRETLASGAAVFSFGGIGATPDDLTRQAAARAFDCELIEHPLGIKILRNKFSSDLNHRRRQLVNFPQGAELIPNPVNQVPGFSLNHHFFVPGFPNMSHPMVEWVLDTYFATSFEGAADIEYLLQTSGVYESDLIPMIEDVLEKHPDLKIACLPKSDLTGQVELGVKGQPQPAEAGFQHLISQLKQASINYKLLPQTKTTPLEKSPEP